MAQTKTQKEKKKLQRQGKLDYTLQRQVWENGSGATRKTPTKIEKQRRMERKHKSSDSYMKDSYSCA